MDVARVRIPSIGGLRGFDILLGIVELAEHQVAVLEPAKRLKILAAFGKVHAFVQHHGGVVSNDVGTDHVVPQAEAEEDVGGHVHGMRSGWSDLRVGASRGQGEDGVIGIVKRVDDVVCRARMFRIGLENLQTDGCGESLAAKSAVGRANSAEKGERVQHVDLVIVLPFVVHPLHRLGISGVAGQFVPWRVEKLIDGVEVAFSLGVFAWQCALQQWAPAFREPSWPCPRRPRPRADD